MRKITVFLLLTALLLLNACTVQENMNADIFAERFCNRSGCVAGHEGIVFSGNKALCFVQSENGTQLLLGARIQESGEATSVSVSTDFTFASDVSKARTDFVEACENAVAVFAAGDYPDYASVFSALAGGDTLPEDHTAYHDTQWYRYALIVTADSGYFSVESKRAVPDTGVEFSLRDE